MREHEKLENEDSAQVVLGEKAAKDVGKKDQEGVFVVGKDNKVAFRPVQVGIAGEEYFEVLSGLQEGETIVVGQLPGDPRAEGGHDGARGEEGSAQGRQKDGGGGEVMNDTGESASARRPSGRRSPDRRAPHRARTG